MLRFDQDSHHPTRALQAYLILIGIAAERKTIRYGQLAERMHFGEWEGVGRGSVLAKPLGCIIHWCAKHGLPRLTTLVVVKATGVPSDGIDPFVKPEGVPAMQEKVYDEDWYAFVPPTIEELAQCRGELDEAEKSSAACGPRANATRLFFMYRRDFCCLQAVARCLSVTILPGLLCTTSAKAARATAWSPTSATNSSTCESRSSHTSTRKGKITRHGDRLNKARTPVNSVLRVLSQESRITAIPRLERLQFFSARLASLGPENEMVTQTAYDEWPLFQRFRTSGEYLDAYRALFGGERQVSDLAHSVSDT